MPLPTCGFCLGSTLHLFSDHLPENPMCKLISSAYPLSWILDVTRHTAATAKTPFCQHHTVLHLFYLVKLCEWVYVCVWVCAGTSRGQQWHDQPVWAICCGCWELNAALYKSSKSPWSWGHLCSLSKLSFDVSVHHDYGDRRTQGMTFSAGAPCHIDSCKMNTCQER